MNISLKSWLWEIIAAYNFSDAIYEIQAKQYSMAALSGFLGFWLLTSAIFQEIKK